MINGNEVNLDHAHCTSCGYSLRGTTTFRCSECGLRFDITDVLTFDLISKPRKPPALAIAALCSGVMTIVSISILRESAEFSLPGVFFGLCVIGYLLWPVAGLIRIISSLLLTSVAYLAAVLSCYLIIGMTCAGALRTAGLIVAFPLAGMIGGIGISLAITSVIPRPQRARATGLLIWLGGIAGGSFTVSTILGYDYTTPIFSACFLIWHTVIGLTLGSIPLRQRLSRCRSLPYEFVRDKT